MTSITAFLSTFKEECCPLCYIEFSKNPAIMICTAQHVVCRACIDKLEKEYRKCPECKRPFRDKEQRSEYKAMRRLNDSMKEMGYFQPQFQIEEQEDIALFQKMTVINSVLYYNIKQYKKAKNLLCSAFNGLLSDKEIGNISDVNTQDFDPIIKTVLKLKGFKLLNKLIDIYQLKEKSKYRKSNKPCSCKTQPTSKSKPKINDHFQPLPFSLQSFQIRYKLYKKYPEFRIYINEMITLYSSRPRQHKRLPNHFSFLKKHIFHPQRDIQINATIGLIIYMSLEKKHFRAMNQLDIALKQKDFVETINHCKNKALIHHLKEAISSSLRKIKSWMLIQALALHLGAVPRVVNIEEMLFLAGRNRWVFWDVMAQTYYSDHPQLKLKMAASYLKRENGRTQALRLYNDILMNQKANRMEVMALIKKSFTEEEEANFLQYEGYYRGEQYDFKLLAEWRNIRQMLKQTNEQI